MSFSHDVKKEILQSIGSGRHCQIAELAAIFEFCGFIKVLQDGQTVCGISTGSDIIANKCFTLLKKTFNIYSDVQIRRVSKKSKTFVYELMIFDEEIAKNLLMALKVYDEKQGLCRPINAPASSLLLKKDCCKRAYLRGVYLAVGSMSDPQKGYHMEFIFDKRSMADNLMQILKEFNIEAKTVLRKKYHVVYIKDGEAIVDMLNVLGAHVALMELENTRIYKDVRNSINRRVNCETANIAKTVDAANKQVEDILFLKEKYGLDNLPDNLRSMAKLRLEYQDATLAELSQLSDPPVGKSGINHRLRKLSELAESLR